jgi:hypothetical protein
VNNAAIQIEAGDLAPPFAEQAAPTMHTNLVQTVALTEALRPSLTEAARVVFVASMAVCPTRLPARFLHITCAYLARWRTGHGRLRRQQLRRATSCEIRKHHIRDPRFGQRVCQCSTTRARNGGWVAEDNLWDLENAPHCVWHLDRQRSCAVSTNAVCTLMLVRNCPLVLANSTGWMCEQVRAASCKCLCCDARARERLLSRLLCN